MMLAVNFQTFHDRYPFLGPAFWTLSIQYYLIQVIAAKAWTNPSYNWLHNTISDLGNTACGPYNGRTVCSPLHLLMNISFIVLGSTMILGSLLVFYEFRRSVDSAVGFSFIALAGFGAAMVGLFPENTVPALHTFGAVLPLLIGNLGLLVLGISLDAPKAMRIYILLTGLIALTASIFFFAHVYLGLGEGGMERLVSYPQTIWLIVFGIYISRNRYRRSKIHTDSKSKIEQIDRRSKGRH